MTLASSATSSGTCADCANSGGTAMDAFRQFADNMNEITDGVLDVEIISDNMNYSNKCDNFVGNGEVNAWGDVVNSELGKPKYQTLINQGPRDIKEHCPNYDRMSIADRKGLVVLTMTAMAHYESSCNFRETATGPNGTAAGLLQLHKGKEGRYSSGCRNGDSASAQRTLVCGLSMLNDQIVGRGERLFSSASYWEVLRPRGRSKKAKKIMAAITKYPACTVRASNVAGRNAAAPRVAQR
ncbi:hypothetical protein [Bdellovibrio sp. HCB337]|uniref:hypothetical protein n=1 Tax=Bdellovibrio sp. HCB337 TaxID=3394358 RepID=UPI0039A50B0F